MLGLTSRTIYGRTSSYFCRLITFNTPFCFCLSLVTSSGFTLFLGFLLIDRMHHYLRKLVVLRSNGGTSKEEVESEKLLLKEKEEKSASEVTSYRKRYVA